MVEINLTFKQKIKDWLKKNYPNFFVVSNTSVLTKIRVLSGIFRVSPDFIIIGAQKCGTTSLYDYLCMHQNIYPAITKQVNYFDFNYKLWINWYKAHFDTIFKKFFITKILRKKFLCGEATPDYINHPHSPKRIFSIYPKIKLILIFRDPIERAYSNYQHNIRDGTETLEFEDALKKEKERTEAERNKILKDKNYFSQNFRSFQYLERGKYIEQLKIWENYFPKDQILILFTEDLDSNPEKVLKDIFNFLNLKNQKINTKKRLNVGKYNLMKKDTKDFLKKYYSEYNQQLFDHIGKKNFWDY